MGLMTLIFNESSMFILVISRCPLISWLCCKASCVHDLAKQNAMWGVSKIVKIDNAVFLLAFLVLLVLRSDSTSCVKTVVKTVVKTHAMHLFTSSKTSDIAVWLECGVMSL